MQSSMLLRALADPASNILSTGAAAAADLRCPLLWQCTVPTMSVRGLLVVTRWHGESGLGVSSQ